MLDSCQCPTVFMNIFVCILILININFCVLLSAAHAVLFSGCADNQTSADTHVGGVGATGAMTFAFMSTLKKNPNQTYGQLLQSMRGELNSGGRRYTQVPQLSSGRPIDLNSKFVM